jgi:hypothetical protein
MFLQKTIVTSSRPIFKRAIILTLAFLTALTVDVCGLAAQDTGVKTIAFMAGRRSHGYGSHEHYAGCMILAAALRKAMPGYEVHVFRDGWPEDANAFGGIDALVMYSDGGNGHPVNQHLGQVDALVKDGVGVACMHYAVEVPKGDSRTKFLDWIGGYFETDWSVNPHWTAKYEKFPKHPITRGVLPFEIHDEWYYHMRFRKDMAHVTPILSAIPPQATLAHPDGARSGNPHVRAAVAKGEVQHMAWASENESGSRGFGFTGGHFHWNWGDPNFRKLVLNAIVWVAQGEVPKSGVEDPAVTLEQLEKNQDYNVPDNFNREAIRERLKLPGTKKAPGVPTSSVKPVFQSDVITSKTEAHYGNQAEPMSNIVIRRLAGRNHPRNFLSFQIQVDA